MTLHVKRQRMPMLMQRKRLPGPVKNWNELKEILKEDGREMKEEARAKVLDQLNRLERALEKDEASIDEMYDA